VRVRHAVAKIAHEAGRHSYPEIGRRLGGRDHSTVLHSHRKCIERMRREPDYAALVRRLGKLAKRSRPFAPSPPRPRARPAPPKVPRWHVPAHLLPKEEQPWWAREVSDDDLLSEAVRAHYANGGDCLEVWG
jgi:hypothetical protein